MNIYNDVLDASRLHEDKSAMFLWGKDGLKYSYSYREMIEQIDVFSSVLEKIGICAGDRIIIIAESCPEWSIAYLAAMKLNATAVLLDAMLQREDLLSLIERSDAAAIYTSPTLISVIGNDHDMPIMNVYNHGEVFDESEIHKKRTLTIKTDKSISSIIYSSGTTKIASGIMHGHEAVIGSSLMCCTTNNIDGEDRFFGILPNSHIYGLYTQVVAPLILGASVCFVESMTEACLVGAMAEYQPTVFPAVPKVFDMLKTSILRKINSKTITKIMFAAFFPICLKLREKFRINLGKVLFKAIQDGLGGKMRVLASAGAPLDKKTAEFYLGTGFDMLITYGATETSIPTIGNYGKNITSDSCGKPYSAVTIKLDEHGEILIKSPYVMLGYFHDEQATSSAFTEDGWFKTGDIAHLDRKGNVCISGRIKDNIVLATGKKIAPDDIESAYSGINGVKELVICGIPTKDGGHDLVHAFVVADIENQAEVLSLIKQKSSLQTLNMKLNDIHFVDEIPKTSLQKPKRFLLRKRHLESIETSAVKSKSEKLNVSDFVIKAIATAAQTEVSEISLETKFFEELAIDSLGAINLSLEIEEHCGINIIERINPHMTVADLIEVASGGIQVESKSIFSNLLRQKKLKDYAIFNFARKILGGIYNIETANDSVLPENSGYIICANHVTNFDYMLLSLTFKKARFMKFACMAKQELFRKNSDKSLFVRMFGMIPVDRSGNASKSIKLAKEKLIEKWGILIHPEGTRSRNGELGEFKKGAAMLSIESGVPIVPAYIFGGYEIYPPTKKIPKIFNWKKLRKYAIQVVYGEPIFPNDLTIEKLIEKVNASVKTLAEKSKSSMSAI